MKRIIIIGGGVIGFCTAWYCRQKGHQVVVLERGAPSRDCCSLGNAGFIVPSHIIPLVAPGMVSMGFRMMRSPESPLYIKRRIDEASKYVPLDQLCLSPQCGFASTEEGNVLAEDEQWAKLRMIVELADEVWGR